MTRWICDNILHSSRLFAPLLCGICVLSFVQLWYLIPMICFYAFSLEVICLLQRLLCHRGLSSSAGLTTGCLSALSSCELTITIWFHRMLTKQSEFSQNLWKVQYITYSLQQIPLYLMGGCLGPRSQQCYAVAAAKLELSKGAAPHEKSKLKRAPALISTIGKLIGTIVLGTDAAESRPLCPPPPLFAWFVSARLLSEYRRRRKIGQLNN